MAEVATTTWESTAVGGHGTGWRRSLVVAVVVLLAVLLGCAVAVGWETYRYARELDGRVLPGAVVAGVDLSGMTHAEGVDAVRAVTASRMDRAVTVSWGGHTWETTPRELGAVDTAEEAVAEAVAASEQVGWSGLVGMRWLDHSLDFRRDVAVFNDPERVRRFVDGIAAELNLPARDAVLDHSTGWVTIIPEHAGRVVDTDAAHVAVLHGLNGGPADVNLLVHDVRPAVTAADYGQVLLLRQREHKLYLYQNGQITHSWLVAVGTGGYPTPTGVYEVTLKRHMPTWINPDPIGWGRGMPARIGPGPGNPLGVRALNWNASGIRFHGTQNVGSLGRDASHGCVRLSNTDVVQLFDLVNEGATIVSLRA